MRYYAVMRDGKYYHPTGAWTEDFYLDCLMEYNTAYSIQNNWGGRIVEFNVNPVHPLNNFLV